MSLELGILESGVAKRRAGESRSGESRIRERRVRKGGRAPVRLSDGSSRLRGLLDAADAAAGLGDQGGRAFLGQAHAFGQLAGRTVITLLNAGRAVGQSATDVLKRLLRSTLGLGDALAQTVRDARDLATQFLQREGVAIIGRDQPLIDALGQPAHIRFNLAAQRLA